MRRLVVIAVCCIGAAASAQGTPDADAATPQQRIRLEIAHRQLAAAIARGDSFKEQITSYRAAAVDAKAAASEARLLGLVGMIGVGLCAIVFSALAFRRSTPQKAEDEEQNEAVRQVFIEVEKLTEATQRQQDYLETLVLATRKDRASILDGLRLFYYRQAYDFKAQGAFGRAVLFTVHALVAEFEAAELLGDEARFQYARVALGNHGRLLVKHVEDYAKETEQASWDTRDLEEIRKLKRFATPDLIPTIDLLEQYTIRSVERLARA